MLLKLKLRSGTPIHITDTCITESSSGNKIHRAPDSLTADCTVMILQAANQMWLDPSRFQDRGAFVVVRRPRVAWPWLLGDWVAFPLGIWGAMAALTSASCSGLRGNSAPDVILVKTC
jgi:hypothetical protein